MFQIFHNEKGFKKNPQGTMSTKGEKSALQSLHILILLAPQAKCLSSILKLVTYVN